MEPPKKMSRRIIQVSVVALHNNQLNNKALPKARLVAMEGPDLNNNRCHKQVGSQSMVAAASAEEEASAAAAAARALAEAASVAVPHRFLDCKEVHKM